MPSDRLRGPNAMGRWSFRATVPGHAQKRGYPRNVGYRAAPSSTVLRRFDASGRLEPLDGDRAWKVGHRVLKPVDAETSEIEWQAAALSKLAQDGYRLALPMPATDGSIVVEDWTAWPFLRGRYELGRWTDIIEVSRRFHAEVASLGKPRFIDERSHRWAIGDRVAWGDLADEPYRHIPFVADLRDSLRPIHATDQLIHGDLAGNVLFAADEPPAIIDLALYWRPIAYAEAILVADALIWEGAGDDLFDYAKGTHPDFGQFLARALIFRLVATLLGGFEDSAEIADRHGRVVGLLG
jgi:uncharacterized protein (TIGR02569 family)